MIKHVWSVMARQSIIDPDTNSVTIVEVLENIRIDVQLKDNPLMSEYDREQVNAFPMNFELISLFYRKKKGLAKTVYSEIKVVDAAGKVIGEFTNPVEFQAEHDRMRMRAKFDSIGVNKSGEYNFKVYLKQTEDGEAELVAEIPLSVSINIDGEQVA